MKKYEISQTVEFQELLALMRKEYGNLDAQTKAYARDKDLPTIRYSVGVADGFGRAINWLMTEAGK